MRRLILFSIISTLLTAVIVISHEAKQKPQANIVQRQEGILRESAEKTVEIHPVIRALNEKNGQIRSFVSEEVTFRTWERGMRFRTGGKIYYEKDKKFRLIVESAFGKELDLGSNEEIFWYWSRRDRQPGLHFATHENFSKTRLKTPFNPVFMQQSLGLDEIDLTGARIAETERELMVSYNRANSVGDPIVYSLIVDKEKLLVDGCLITDLRGNVLASAEVRERMGELPARMLYLWTEEDRMLSISFDTPRINVKLSELHWQVPDHKPRIDMSEE